MREKGFLKGAIILTIFGIVGKIIVAIYRVPLTRIVGVEGLGVYQMIFPLYSLLLTISSSAFPNAISKMLSEAYAKNKYDKVKVVLKTAFKILFICSFICFAFIVLFSKIIAKLQGNFAIWKCYLAIAPSVVFVAFIACFRGYFQAKQNMLPSAISGLVEQLVKFATGLIFASVFVKFGVVMGAFGALLGVTLSEIVAFLYLFIRYRIDLKCDNYKYNSINKTCIREMLSITIPITLGGIILPLSQFVDSALVVNTLLKIGYSSTTATKMFGITTGVVGSIINMPVVFSLAISTSVIPAISKQNITKQCCVMKTALKSIYITLILGIVSALVVFFGSDIIINILYGKSLSTIDIVLSTRLLKISSISIIYLSLVQTTTGVLQGLGKIKTPIISLAVGVLIKVFLNILLISNPKINIFGAEIATIMCFAIAATINIINIVIIGRKGKETQIIAK